jgi:peptidyl-prolyl cis-trans isomerase D
MLQKMREHSQSTATKILLGVLIIVFTMFGFGAFEAFMKADPPAAKVNGVKITQSQLAMETDRQRQRILAQMGERANPDLIDAARLRQSVLDSLINQTILMESAKDMGLRVSEAEVDRVIVENPQFQVGDKFDPDLYRRLLANAGHTPLTFKAELTNNFTLAQLTGAVRETPFITDDELRDMARLITQTRDIAFLVYTPELYEGEVTVSDDDVNTYYQAHLPDFMTEDTVDVDYVKLSVEDLAKDDAFAPTEEQIAAQYVADAKAFKPEERRRIAHILLQVNGSRSEDAAKAELAAIKERLAHGERFEDIARKVSEDPGSAKSGGDLGLISKGALAPEFEQAAWTLDVNQVSDPVRTEFGVHLIKVLAIQNDQYAKLDEVRPQIISRLREQAADEKYRAKIRELDELAFESPDELAHLSETSGLPIQHVVAVTQSTGPAPFEAPALRAAAFGDEVISRGFNSRVIEVDKNAYVLRIKEHRPPVQRSLADVTDGVRTQLVKEAATDRAREAAAEAMARVSKGEAASVIAAAYGIEWQVSPSTSRGTPRVDREIIKAAFELPRPTADVRSVTSTELGGGRIAVVTVSAVKDGDYGALTETERASIRTQLARRIGNEEFTSLFLTLRDSSSVDRI